VADNRKKPCTAHVHVHVDVLVHVHGTRTFQNEAAIPTVAPMRKLGVLPTTPVGCIASS
jgi:hypothetical protein